MEPTNPFFLGVYCLGITLLLFFGIVFLIMVMYLGSREKYNRRGGFFNLMADVGEILRPELRKKDKKEEK